MSRREPDITHMPQQPEADDGTRTHDLLHGKDVALGDVR